VSLGELFGQQTEREETPGEIDVSREKQRRLSRAVQLPYSHDERVHAASELLTPLVGVEVGGERLDRAIVHLELAAKIAASRDQEERPASRAVQLGVIELNGLAGHVGEHRQGIAELARIEAREEFIQGVHDYDGA
jgi:hypothetical protein